MIFFISISDQAANEPNRWPRTNGEMPHSQDLDASIFTEFRRFLPSFGPSSNGLSD